MNADPISRLVAELAKLPGIGEKTAQRLAFFILKSPREYAESLAFSIREVVEKVHLSSRCCTLTEKDLEKHASQLPDAADQAESVGVAQPALGGRES